LQEQYKICETIEKYFDLLNNIENNINSIKELVYYIKNKILDHFFCENSSYKSYYPNYQIKNLCKLDKNDILEQGLHPYLEAKVIRGKKVPKYIQKGSFIQKGTKIILVDGENSGEVMIAPCDGYLGSTFRILKVNEKVNDDKYATPVLTAGKSFLLGYTNETEGVYHIKSGEKVIIFDDFTTSSHLVDFDFKVKSSAMKILRSTDNELFNIEYLYYFLKTLKIDTDNHKRYWISKYAPMKVKVHTYEEQCKIIQTIKKIQYTLLNIE